LPQAGQAAVGNVERAGGRRLVLGFFIIASFVLVKRNDQALDRTMSFT